MLSYISDFIKYFTHSLFLRKNNNKYFNEIKEIKDNTEEIMEGIKKIEDALKKLGHYIY